jgi:hypothetical protein
MEGEPARFQLSKRDAQLLQRASVKKVDTTTAVDEHAGETADVRIGTHDMIHDQSILFRAGHQPRVVLAPPGNGCLRPMHELGLRRHHGVHLCFMPKVAPFVLAGGNEDVILLHICREVIILIRLTSSRVVLLVLLTFSQSRLRCARDLPSALLQLSHETALTRGVGRFPARGGVKFTGLIKRSIEGVLALFAPMTAACSPRASLVGSRSL